jgi:hypothetical protein
MTAASANIVMGISGGTSSAPVADGVISSAFKTFGTAVQNLLAAAGWVKAAYGDQVDWATAPNPTYVNPLGSDAQLDTLFGETCYKFNDPEQTAPDGSRVHIRIQWRMRRYCYNTSYSFSFVPHLTFYLNLDTSVSAYAAFESRSLSNNPLASFYYYGPTADVASRTCYAVSTPGYAALVGGSPYTYDNYNNRVSGWGGFQLIERARDPQTGATLMGSEGGLVALHSHYHNYQNSMMVHSHIMRQGAGGNVTVNTGSITTTARGSHGNSTTTQSFSDGTDVYVWPSLVEVSSTAYVPSVVGYCHTDLSAFTPVSIPTRVAGVSRTYLPLGVLYGQNAVVANTSNNGFTNAAHAIRYD